MAPRGDCTDAHRWYSTSECAPLIPLELVLGERLEALYRRYGPETAATDPIVFVGRYAEPEDREVAGWIASAFAYGQVRDDPGERGPPARGARAAARARRSTRVARLPASSPATRSPGSATASTAPRDAAALLFAIARAREAGGVACAASSSASSGPRSRTSRASALARRRAHRGLRLPAGPRRAAHCPEGSPVRFFFPDPAAGSACKRWNLYLRWMVRRDALDFGLWPGIPTDRLVIPTDTHVHRIARRLGLTRRRTADWKAARQITDALARFDPARPGPLRLRALPDRDPRHLPSGHAPLPLRRVPGPGGLRRGPPAPAQRVPRRMNDRARLLTLDLCRRGPPAVGVVWIKSLVPSGVAVRARSQFLSAAPELPIFDRAGKKIDLAEAEGQDPHHPLLGDLVPALRRGDRRRSRSSGSSTRTASDVELYAISVDKDWKTIDDFIAKNPSTLPLYHDPDAATAKRFGTTQYPETYIVNEKGRVLFRVQGAVDWSDPEVRAGSISCSRRDEIVRDPLPGRRGARRRAARRRAEGYSWQTLDPIQASFLLPAGWHFKAERVDKTLAYFLSEEDDVKGALSPCIPRRARRGTPCCATTAAFERLGEQRGPSLRSG